MKRNLALFAGLLLASLPSLAHPQTSLSNVILGHSGSTGSLGNLRRIIEREKLWEKHGLSVKSVYFGSGGVLTQALAGGNIAGSESEVPGMLNLTVSGVLDAKLLTVTINKIEHVFVVRKNIAKNDDLKGKKLAVSRFGSASDTVTRLVLKSWKIDPEKEVILLQSGNTPTRMSALAAGHVDGALVSPESIHKILASACCRILFDLSELPMDYARYGYVFPTAWIKSNRDVLRRLLMAYLEGIAIFRTRPTAAFAALEDDGIKDPAVQKDIYERSLKHVREYPIPEPNGVQNVLESLPHPNAKTSKPAQLIDTSVLEEIRKSGFIDKLYGRPS
ncbi:MAG: ABC transporter substrate-binding protein [Deltaproteobacteria bacterium]|nr:ABC transporter substrate-binding protein [Deltaproteobacteria bacterium]MBM4299634.1 ABC transporter substrate-binding protein [Deltaproteobacteria bacterium]